MRFWSKWGWGPNKIMKKSPHHKWVEFWFHFTKWWHPGWTALPPPSNATALRTHFEVLAWLRRSSPNSLSLEAYKPSKMFSPRLKDSIVFDLWLWLKWAMATAFFSHYLGNWKKPCGKFEKTFFLLIFGERLIFCGKLASSRAKTFLGEVA